MKRQMTLPQKWRSLHPGVVLGDKMNGIAASQPGYTTRKPDTQSHQPFGHGWISFH